MPKYMLQVSYTAEGAKGLLKDGGSKRRQAAESLVKSVGGKLEAFYFAFGGSDAFVIVDLPDNASVAAASITRSITAAGAASSSRSRSAATSIRRAASTARWARSSASRRSIGSTITWARRPSGI